MLSFGFWGPGGYLLALFGSKLVVAYAPPNWPRPSSRNQLFILYFYIFFFIFLLLLFLFITLLVYFFHLNRISSKAIIYHHINSSKGIIMR